MSPRIFATTGRLFLDVVLLIASILVLCAPLCGAESSISGTVKDKSGAVVPSANVMIRRKTGGCNCDDCANKAKCDCCIDQVSIKSDDAGSFRIKVAKGDYEIRVDSAGHKSAEKNVRVTSGEAKKVEVTLGTGDVGTP